MQENRRSLVACWRSAETWLHDIFDRKVNMRIRLRIIEDARPASAVFGQPVGGICHAPGFDDGILAVFALGLLPGIPWLDAAYPVLCYLERAGDAYAAGEGGRLDGFRFGEAQTVLDAIGDHMRITPPEGPLAWYVRLPDPAGFLMNAAPAITARMPGTVLDGWSGTFWISFYEDETAGLALTLENGRLVSAENGAPLRGSDCQMPPEYFKKILLGYCSVDEIEAESAEVSVSGRARAMLRVLFPRAVSRILSIA